MARKQIRKRMKTDYESQEGKGGYEAVGDIWGLTGGMVWRIVKEPGYWPKDKEIRRRIAMKARELGLAIKQRGRKKDLFSMKPAELLWRLQNRVEV